METGIRLDEDQTRAAARLHELVDRRGKPIRRHRGIYLCGRPGRGKTMLMDRFFAEVASDRKRRYHFHQFFAQLHAAAHRFDSIDSAVDALLGRARLICFDEFHVHDIGDAMLIARLLDNLFARKIVLVVTSNYPPRDLLPNPLFHDKFLPTIERIVAHLEVVSLDGPIDYRASGTHRSTGFPAGRYVDISNGRTGGRDDADVDTATDAHADGPGTIEVPIGTRHVRARRATADALAIDFDALCATATSAADYVELARRFRRWTIREVPVLRAVPPDWAMRFANVIDVLYNSDRELTVLARAPLADLVADVDGVPDMARTASRLCELTQVKSAIFR